MFSNPSRTVLWLLAIGCAIYFLSSYFFKPERSASEVSTSSAPTEETIVNGQPVKEELFSAEDLADVSFQSCKTLLDELAKHNQKWGHSMQSQWTSYLEDGYSIDEVVLAIGYFRHEHAASAFYIDQLREQTPLVQYQRRFTELLREQYPDENIADKQYNVKLPTIPFRDFASLSEEEQLSVIEQNEVYIDDIAYFMGMDIETSTLIRLIDKVDDLNAVIGYDRHPVVSLFDYAVVELRKDVVRYLLSIGVMPTMDAYSATSMELALGLLFNRLKTNKPDDVATLIDIVSQLMARGVPAYFSQQDQAGLAGDYPGRVYEFTRKDIDELYYEYGVDLMSIPARQRPVPDPSSPLIEDIRPLKESYMASVTTKSLPKDNQAICQQKVRNTYNQWKPEKASRLVKQWLEDYGEGSTQFELQLGNSDPLLYDAYRESFATDRLKLARNSTVFAQVSLLMRQQISIEEYVDTIFAMQADLDLQRSACWNVVRFRPDYYQALLNSGLPCLTEEYWVFERTNGLNREFVEQLSAQGGNVFTEDSSGKTLVYYATQKNKLSLLQYLQEEGYPFAMSHRGQDPLHAALNIRGLAFNPEQLSDIVDILMRYSPEINQYHLSRMAVVKLFYPELYDSLVERYPALSVSPQTPLQSVY